MDRDELKGWLGQGWSLEQIGRHVGRNPATVSYWLKKYRLKPNGRAKHAARGAISREELERAVACGLTIAELAEQFNRSKATVRYWMARYDLRTGHTVGRRGGNDLLVGEHDEGTLVVSGECRRHGMTEFVSESNGRFRCKRCRSEAISRRRRKVKAILVEEAGGCCCICGYDRSPRALHFHHLNPDEKRMALSSRGQALAIETLRAEARKCVLLCSNCHAEVEAGVSILPLE